MGRQEMIFVSSRATCDSDPGQKAILGQLQAIVVFGVLAQLGEHLPYKQRVIGSSPIGPTNLDNFILFNIHGQIPEWPKGTDCKSAGNAFGGSNPPLPILNNAG